MQTEKRIQDEVRLALSDCGLVFRTNAGDFWQGNRVYSKEFNQNVLINLRCVQGLPMGFTDLIFISNGYIAFIETKAPSGRPTPEQQNFIDRMRKLHHRAGIARSINDALMIVRGDAP